MSLARQIKKLFDRKTNLSYGLEITDAAVRLAAVPKGAARPVPKVLYEHPIHYIPDSLHAINMGKEVQKSLQHVVSHFGISEAHVGIPDRHFLFRCIKIPALSGGSYQEELHQVIDDYLLSEVVLPRRDVVCEYEIVAKENNFWYVAIAVAPKFVIRKYFALLELVRIKPITIEANIHAMHRACIEDLTQDLGMVLRVEEGIAHAAIVGTGAVLFDRDFVLPNHKDQVRFLREEMMRMYREWVTMPYKNELERKPIIEITLFGGHKDLVILQEELARQMRMPVRLKRPVLDHIEQHHEVPSVHADNLHRFSSAIGLAMQGR